MSKRWLAKHKKDFYHKKSKKDGFRARSAYKLLQINEKFKIFNNANSVLDLGAAPGSWIQVILSSIGHHNPLILGIDYKRMGDIEGAKLLSINVFSEKLETEIVAFFKDGIDLIISDMAPKISGNKELDAAKTIALVERAYDLAEKFMNNGGNFVAKIFHCPELNILLKKTKKHFNSSQIYKPKASRSASREMYIISKGFVVKKKRNKKN